LFFILVADRIRAAGEKKEMSPVGLSFLSFLSFCPVVFLPCCLFAMLSFCVVFDVLTLTLTIAH